MTKNFQIALDKAYTDPHEAAQYIVAYMATQGKACTVRKRVRTLPGFFSENPFLEIDGEIYILKLLGNKVMLKRYFGLSTFLSETE